jgi:hypothetical protein
LIRETKVIDPPLLQPTDQLERVGTKVGYPHVGPNTSEVRPLLRPSARRGHPAGLLHARWAPRYGRHARKLKAPLHGRTAHKHREAKPVEVWSNFSGLSVRQAYRCLRYDYEVLVFLAQGSSVLSSLFPTNPMDTGLAKAI